MLAASAEAPGNPACARVNPFPAVAASQLLRLQVTVGKGPSRGALNKPWRVSGARDSSQLQYSQSVGLNEKELHTSAGLIIDHHISLWRAAQCAYKSYMFLCSSAVSYRLAPLPITLQNKVMLKTDILIPSLPDRPPFRILSLGRRKQHQA